jgi:hypothetical protein
MREFLKHKMQPPRRGDAEEYAEKKNLFFSSSLRFSRRLGVSAVAFCTLLILIALPARAELRPVTTNHYRIQTDLDSAFADELGQRMDQMFDEYSRRLADFSPRDDGRRFDVYLFDRRETYLAYTRYRFPNTGGVFIAGKALAAFLEGQGRDQLRRTLQHEAFHQFAYSAIGPNLPVWLNEGLAQIFEEGIYNGRTFSIGQVPPRRVRQLQKDIDDGHLFDFRAFMSMPDQEWHGNMNDKELGARQYNQAWAMAQYLIYAEDEPGHPRFRSRLIDMLKLIHDGKDGHEAFVEAFSDNIEGFQHMFVDYARSLQPTREATFIENQDVLADMLIELKNRGRTYTEMSSFKREIIRGRYQVDYTRGSVRWNSNPDPASYFRDAEGRDMGGDQLFFQPRNGAPLPDIISRPVHGVQLHTFFSQAGDKIEHEIAVETANP